MPLNVGSPIGSNAYTTAATQNAYANAYAGATVSNSGGGKKSFRYPLKRLDNTSDYLEIKIFDYVAGGFDISEFPNASIQSPTLQQRQKANKVSPTHYIILPIPQNVSDSISVTWGEDNIDAIQAAALAGGQTFIDDGPIKGAEKAMEVLKKMGGDAIKNSSVQKAIQTALTGRAVSALGGNVNATGLISRTTGQVLNSNLELLFQGVNLRSFQFTFDLAPRSRSEAEEVKQIIRTFKQTMSAKSGGAGSGTNTNLGLFISAPSVYQLTYKTGPAKHQFLNTFKPCALTDISVNYTASGTYATYEDSSPVHMQMALAFKEINPVYAEDYETPEAQEGVGY
jgi:hypothetical protein